MLQIRLLGQFDTRIDGKRVTIPTRAAQSLLAYLVLTAGTPHRREKLAGLFWPETSDENARKNLRQELWRIRKAISAQGSSEKDYFLADELTLAFHRDVDYWLDVAQIERPDTDLQSLMTNLALYQGELLPGFYEEWISIERERVQSIFEARMAQLLEQLITNERWVAVEEWGERWLALSGSREPAYRALMLASGARGDMAKVASLYQRCTDELLEQLGVEPSAETRALYDGLLKGARAPRTQIQPSGTITFLFTDIEGSTRLLEKLGDQYAAALSQHHEIMRTALRKWNGHEVDTQGDAFFVTFTRAIDAVQCAADAQRAFAAHSWTPGAQLRVRMGLHTGEPLIASTGYVGMDVHRAARIGDVGHGGQVLLSQTTRDLVVQDLPQGLSIRDLGDHRLKDMKYPAPIYQLVIDGLAAEFPALKTKFTGHEAPTPGEPPFKGLQFFDEADSALFFGRELLTAKLVQRLRETRFLSVVIGASGSGKSSLVRAGLLPALKKGDPLLDGTKPPKGSTQWHIHILTPTAHPLEALATELTHGSESVTATATLLDDLMREPRSLSLFLTRKYPKGHTLLVMDQFEELFTLCRDEFEREAFIDNLLSAVTPENSHISLIVTLRADFYAHLSQYPELRELVARHQEYIGPMNPEELRRAMEEPARRGHWEFEPGLVDLILRDVGDEPGALPLLSHALLETWKRRAGHMLTLKGYADAGGVHGAIAHTAEGVYQNLSEEEQGIARNIFLRLTELGEGTEDTRRRASFDELVSQEGDASTIRSVLNVLADARLVTLSEDTAEVAHEALIREWPTLREWLNQDRDGLRMHRHLTESARDWELLGRDPGALYRGAHLGQAREWAVLHPRALNAGERAFLSASIDQEQREAQEKEEQQQRELESAQKLAETERARAEEQTHSANRLRTRNRLITGVAVVAFILAVLAGVFSLQSNQNARRAETHLGIANQQRVAAQNAQATAIAESQVRATQQVIAEENFRRAEAQRLAAEANKVLLSQGSPELIALLSLQSIKTQYTPEGDAALTAAARLNYPLRQFIHSDYVADVAFSPDNKYALTGSYDATAKLWDTITGQEIRKLSTTHDYVSNVSFAHDGKTILTSSEYRAAQLWNTATGQEMLLIPANHPSSYGPSFELNHLFSSTSLSPDGKYILTSDGLEKTVTLWDSATGNKVRKFIGHTDQVNTCIFSPDGNYILSGARDKTVRLWNVASGEEIQQFRAHTGEILAVAFSPDGKYIATASADGTARLWDTQNGQELQMFVIQVATVSDVAFSPNGRHLFTASGDNIARVWDTQTGQELQRLPGIAGVSRLAVSPDGMMLLTNGGDGVARLWAVNPSRPLLSFSVGRAINTAAFSPDGKLIFVGGFNGTAQLWDAVAGRKLHDLIGHTDTINFGASFSPDGKYVLTGSWDTTVRLWDVRTGAQVREPIVDINVIDSVAFSPDGKQFVTAGRGGARVWDIESGQETLLLDGSSDLYMRAAFSPDGKHIVTASVLNGGRLWDASTGHVQRELGRKTGRMNSIVFSADGKYILAGSDDGIARLWDIQTGEEIRQFIGHTDRIWTATFSADGKYVATASADGTARLWDAQTGQELRRFIGHTAGVESVAFSPDGNYILTGSDDGTAMMWDVDYYTTIKYLCSVLQRDFTDEERARYNITDNMATCPQA